LEGKGTLILALTVKEFRVQYALGSLSCIDLEKLAKRIGTPRKILTILSKDKERYVKYGVATNIHTPMNILTKLSTDKDYMIQNCVAQNSSTSKKVLKRLSEHVGSNVRYYVAGNPNTPVRVLVKLANDEDVGVYSNARRNLTQMKNLKQIKGQ